MWFSNLEIWKKLNDFKSKYLLQLCFYHCLAFFFTPSWMTPLHFSSMTTTGKLKCSQESCMQHYREWVVSDRSPLGRFPVGIANFSHWELLLWLKSYQLWLGVIKKYGDLPCVSSNNASNDKKKNHWKSSNPSLWLCCVSAYTLADYSISNFCAFVYLAV